MARGFDSKAVTDQQESEHSRLEPKEAPVDLEATQKRRRLELAMVDIQNRLRTVSSGPHREMLERAKKALDKEIARLP